MKNLLILSLFCLFCCFEATLSAQVLQNSAEAGQNRQQIVANKQMIQRDASEIDAFNNTQMRLEEAVLDGDQASIEVLKKDILIAMKREIEQGEARIKSYQKELGQSRQEVRSDNREIRRNRVDAAQSKGDRQDDRRDMARDRRNKADDVADRRDDKFDLEAQKQRTARQKIIFEAITAYNFQSEGPNKMQMVTEFSKIMEADLNALKKELGEDRRESREDSRERRDDRRERRENN